MKTMPVYGGWDKKNWREFPHLGIPWKLIEGHDQQAIENHAGQNLERLFSRHGISACEALAILDDRPWTPMDANEAHDELKMRIEEFISSTH